MDEYDIRDIPNITMSKEALVSMVQNRNQRIKELEATIARVEGVLQQRSDWIRAELLTEYLPVWTKLTDDPDTWPKDQQRIYFAPTNGGHPAVFEVWESPALCTLDGRHSWRPLCDLDHPPEDILEKAYELEQALENDDGNNTKL